MAVVGGAALVSGFFLIRPALGLIVLGLVLLAGAVATAKDKR